MQAKLIGTWKLEALEDLVDGVWTKSFGEKPQGYFSFGQDGRISIQFQQQNVPVFPENPSAEQKAEAYDAYLAYFGAYTVDAAARTFTTQVEGALDPRLIGTKQTRQFEIKDSTLIVGDQVTYRRFFKKVTK